MLIVDDNVAIHTDFGKTLGAGLEDERLADLDAFLFDRGQPKKVERSYDLDFASQGEEAIELAMRALDEGRPYSLVFTDVRMPPGIDGVETARRLLGVDPHVQVVLCTAYSDYQWSDLRDILGDTDRVLILKKPFDMIEVRQLATALTVKHELGKTAALRLHDLDAMVAERTTELARVNQELRDEYAVREKMEVELRLAQKLEAVGQLAAGVAHEINTPTQYVSDTVYYLQGAFEDLMGLLGQSLGQAKELAKAAGRDDVLEALAEAEEDADREYHEEHVTPAFERAVEGLGNIGNIVRAMTEFAHPDGRDKTTLDINQAIRNALTVGRNAYKLVAEIEEDFGETPLVLCHPGDIGQVLLNIIVNAAHAIEDVVGESGDRGTISVSTSTSDGFVDVRIRDTGGGIPEEIRERIYDQFFTTKEVGRGTGQGLSIARTIIVERHNGELNCDTTPGVGTCFHIRLPIDGAPDEAE